MGENLTSNQQAAIAELAAGGTVTAAAKAAGRSRKTVYTWLASPDFIAARRQAEGESLRQLGRRLLSLGEMACQALEAALGEDMPMSVRLRAADLVTSRGPALAELTQVIERLEALEAVNHGKA